ncbi:hypothetical protein [Bacillus suaedaesalsae]|uniref:Uncharacterized protein n=1 Tax=Bacillus suaedaesalsae TaxID=2810349 RepID=A0ABS2DDI2_9BACI|nr:hypothetical protein [Bacillus suaedaesalsae]MBM6616517.1 hypothetical protein [Bacillus suaedaesalsae]
MKKWMVYALLGLILLVITSGFIIIQNDDVLPVFNQEDKRPIQKPKSNVKTEPTISSAEKEFISNQHDFFNETTGWGEIESLQWKKQKENASGIIDFLSNTELSPKLQSDFTAIQELSKLVADGETDKKIVLYLHRLFHDLDIEVNGYRSKDYFEVTEVGNGEKKEVVTELIEKKE